ncbi:interleukin 2 receptor, gamma b isoform X1 [Tachysurus ichikawai]
MTYLPAAVIVPGCLLFLFQGCWSRSNFSSSADGNCISTDYKFNISCLIINLEYVECTWTKLQTQQINYIFSSRFLHNSFRECSHYLWEHSQRVGCRIQLDKPTQKFDPFYTKLFVGGNRSVCKKYSDLKHRVKLNPPYNLTVNSSGRDGEVCMRWTSNTNVKQNCMIYMVRYRKASSSWKSSSSDCVSPLSSGVVYTFQVRSSMSEMCGDSHFWSDWSDPVQWNDNKDIKTAVQTPVYWHTLGIVLGLIVLISLCTLLYFSERIKVVLVPVAPDPSKSLQDLFKKHKGNVESWVYISKELKDAFESDYTESPCVVCDPSSTSETNAEAGPMEQPVS